ncbi:hypothetical protein Q4491_12515 [Photobacterium sp. 2_MG-2023]|uniref:alpha/beta hydrolase n=1 Tax=Photobacterium sp. 2_MG-2023 TaxID=3062663 RepID=UPI0026E284FF|nr:hypothetical protein [Photobacterium sp. 2_MG-2023]MDO6582164.1 hypothetical protein [Photobacterium sp. 2_MG-2023]
MMLKLLCKTGFITVLAGLTGCNSDDYDSKNTAYTHGYPAPDGPYRVGVAAFDVLDAGLDGMSPIPNQTRRLPIKVYYPTKHKNGTYQSYFDRWGHQVGYLDRVRPKDVPVHPNQFKLDELASWSQVNVAIAPAASGSGWPILFYSHGAFLFEVDNTELLEDLASRGYVVVSINHTYISGVASFQDGSSVGTYLPSDAKDVGTDKGFAYFDQVVAPQITHDVISVYQWLSRHSERFDDQLDESRIGTLGYSLGGSAAMNSCAEMPDCVASVNMDGLLLGDVRTQPLNKPLLLLQTPKQVLAQAFEDNGHETYLLTVANTNHRDFMDQNRWVVGYRSGIDGDLMHAIVKQSVGTFFDRYLNDTEIEWPESDAVTIQVK